MPRLLELAARVCFSILGRALSSNEEKAAEGLRVSRINAEIVEIFVRLDDIYDEIDPDTNSMKLLQVVLPEAALQESSGF